MSWATSSQAAEEFATQLAKLLRLDEDTANALVEAIDPYVKDALLAEHEDSFYHNRRPEY
jgi:hypothetical protein